jgi:hypothetical protein
MASMHCTHHESIPIVNDGGLTFGDVRRAVDEFLSDETNDPGSPWHPCECTTTVTAHELDYFSRWTITNSPDKTYDYSIISFDCVGILLMLGLIFTCMASVNYDSVLTFCVALVMWVGELFESFPLIPSMTVQSTRLIKGPEKCGHHLFFGPDNVPVTAEENATLGKIGVVTEGNDPYHQERLRAKAMT